jgi:hypothetical protein
LQPKQHQNPPKFKKTFYKLFIKKMLSPGRRPAGGGAPSNTMIIFTYSSYLYFTCITRSQYVYTLKWILTCLYWEWRGISVEALAHRRAPHNPARQTAKPISLRTEHTSYQNDNKGTQKCLLKQL